MKILIIEDEQELASSISAYLSEENYRCEVADHYASAIEKIHNYNYDCILLDLMLPGGEGLQILSEIRMLNKQDGIIIISAKDSLEDKVKGLQGGADDYLNKPFHLSELSARIFSVVRRKHFANQNTINIDDLEIDLLSKSVKNGKTSLQLTKKEYELLLFLIGNKNRVIAKGALAEHLSGDLSDLLDNHGFVYAHIKNLKKKLSESGCKDYIKTIYGVGYKWEQ